MNNIKQQQRITLKKLAEILELDISSVSLALRNSPKISPQTRQRVYELANQYCYSPNMAARQLRCSAPRLVGLVLPAMMNALTNPMAGRTIQVLAELCTAKGIVFQILSVANLVGSSEEKAVSSLLPEALFVWGDVPCQVIESPMLQKRQVIVLDPNHPSYSGYSGRCVAIDNFAGGVMVARHFLELKAMQLLLVQADENHLGHQARMDGARQEWLRHRPADSIRCCMISQVNDQDLIKFARQGDGAIFCSNDWGALQIWHRLSKLRAAMPRDVRLAGFDGEEAALLAGITTMLFDWEKMAESAFSMLFQSMTDKGELTDKSILIPAVFRQGQTT